MEAAVQRICSSCGNPLVRDGEFCLFCGDVLADRGHPSPAEQRVVSSFEHNNARVPFEYAGFWVRVGAGLVDILLEALAALLITLVVDLIMRIVSPMYGLSPITARYATGIVFILVLTVGAWLYCAFTESSRHRATIGKRIFGLEVLTSSGGRLSFGQATVRHFMKFLSLFTGTVGFMMAGWTKRGQALHDMPQDCVVVRVAEPSLSIFNKHA
jgi:uncharacterized RDD family membrane protein YckC